MQGTKGSVVGNVHFNFVVKMENSTLIYINPLVNWVLNKMGTIQSFVFSNNNKKKVRHIKQYFNTSNPRKYHSVSHTISVICHAVLKRAIWTSQCNSGANNLPFLEQVIR